jgi:hypothetical protein
MDLVRLASSAQRAIKRKCQIPIRSGSCNDRIRAACGTRHPRVCAPVLCLAMSTCTCVHPCTSMGNSSKRFLICHLPDHRYTDGCSRVLGAIRCTTRLLESGRNSSHEDEPRGWPRPVQAVCPPLTAEKHAEKQRRADIVHNTYTALRSTSHRRSCCAARHAPTSQEQGHGTGGPHRKEPPGRHQTL